MKDIRRRGSVQFQTVLLSILEDFLIDSNAFILDWPRESARPIAEAEPRFVDAATNIVLDFHGDPNRARLVVFSDGNHHMALEESVQTFLAANPDARDVFYATTPPGPSMSVMA